jgi:pyruvate dehydrogenase complex dehydrogenase (E1) component
MFDVSGARVEDLFDAWVFAARDVELALVAWAVSPGHERKTAYAAYRAAAEREERAAVVLAAATSLGD